MQRVSPLTSRHRAWVRGQLPADASWLSNRARPPLRLASAGGQDYSPGSQSWRRRASPRWLCVRSGPGHHVARFSMARARSAPPMAFPSLVKARARTRARPGRRRRTARKTQVVCISPPQTAQSRVGHHTSVPGRGLDPSGAPSGGRLRRGDLRRRQVSPPTTDLTCCARASCPDRLGDAAQSSGSRVVAREAPSGHPWALGAGASAMGSPRRAEAKFSGRH